MAATPPTPTLVWPPAVDDESISYTVVERATERGKDLLVDSRGFRYQMKPDRRRSAETWRCANRGSMTTGVCSATVRKVGGKYITGGQTHVCAGQAENVKMEVLKRAKQFEARTAEIRSQIAKQDAESDALLRRSGSSNDAVRFLGSVNLCPVNLMPPALPPSINRLPIPVNLLPPSINRLPIPVNLLPPSINRLPIPVNLMPPSVNLLPLPVNLLLPIVNLLPPLVHLPPPPPPPPPAPPATEQDLKAEKAKRAEKAEKLEKARAERAERIEKAERAEKAEKAERMEKVRRAHLPAVSLPGDDVMYTVLQAATSRGSDLLVDSIGYEYHLKPDKRRTTVTWRCARRSRHVRPMCTATVREIEGCYVRGHQPHICPVQAEKVKAARVQAQGGADDDGDGEDAGDAENKYKPLHLQDMSHSKEYIDVCAADGDETSAYKAVRLQHLALSKTAQDPRAAIAQDVHRYEATQDASSTVDARAAIAEEVSRYEAVRLEDALPGDARAAIAEEVDRYDAVHSEDGELERQAESCAEMTEAAVVHHEEICDDSLANVTTNETGADETGKEATAMSDSESIVTDDPDDYYPEDSASFVGDDDPPTQSMFHIVGGGGEAGPPGSKVTLVEMPEGYTYEEDERDVGEVSWRCSASGGEFACKAAVTQRGTVFLRDSNMHVHDPPPPPPPDDCADEPDVFVGKPKPMTGGTTCDDCGDRLRARQISVQCAGCDSWHPLLGKAGLAETRCTSEGFRLFSLTSVLGGDKPSVFIFVQNTAATTAVIKPDPSAANDNGNGEAEDSVDGEDDEDDDDADDVPKSLARPRATAAAVAPCGGEELAFHEVFDAFSQRLLLRDSRGFTYAKRAVRAGGVVVWRCVARRGATLACPAAVSQRGDAFVPGRMAHTHAADVAVATTGPAAAATAATSVACEVSQGALQCSVPDARLMTVLLSDATPAAAPPPPPPPVKSWATGVSAPPMPKGLTFQIIEGGTQCGTDMLVDSLGYAYRRKTRPTGALRPGGAAAQLTTFWRCASYKKGLACTASVKQRGNMFQAGFHGHIHAVGDAVAKARAFSSATDRASLRKAALALRDRKKARDRELWPLRSADAAEAEVTYEVVAASSRRHRHLLVDSRGYAYNLKREGATTYWRCAARNKTSANVFCRASVAQRGELFQPGQYAHIHPPNGINAKVMGTIKARAINEFFKPVGQIVDSVLEENAGSELALKRANLLRIAARYRAHVFDAPPAEGEAEEAEGEEEGEEEGEGMEMDAWDDGGAVASEEAAQPAEMTVTETVTQPEIVTEATVTEATMTVVEVMPDSLTICIGGDIE